MFSEINQNVIYFWDILQLFTLNRIVNKDCDENESFNEKTHNNYVCLLKFCILLFAKRNISILQQHYKSYFLELNP